MQEDTKNNKAYKSWKRRTLLCNQSGLICKTQNEDSRHQFALQKKTLNPDI